MKQHGLKSNTQQYSTGTPVISNMDPLIGYAHNLVVWMHNLLLGVVYPIHKKHFKNERTYRDLWHGAWADERHRVCQYLTYGTVNRAISGYGTGHDIGTVHRDNQICGFLAITRS